MVGHGGSSAGLYLADPTFPIPSHCASVIVTSTLRVKYPMQSCCPACFLFEMMKNLIKLVMSFKCYQFYSFYVTSY